MAICFLREIHYRDGLGVWHEVAQLWACWCNWDLLRLWSERGTSLDGFRSKKLVGLSVQESFSLGMTGKSGMRLLEIRGIYSGFSRDKAEEKRESKPCKTPSPFFNPEYSRVGNKRGRERKYVRVGCVLTFRSCDVRKTE